MTRTILIMEDNELYSILHYMKEQRAIDFSAYKPGTIKRRLEIRMVRTGMADYGAYYRYLAKHPAETDLLLDAMTISVSHFFRNPFVFELLKTQILPELTAATPKGGLRIWCAGSARGEEAYSLAILLKELISKKAVSDPPFIIATDIDREALAYAGRASYRGDELTEVNKDYLDRYFTEDNGKYSLREEVRSMVTFAWHDITSCRPPKEGIFSDYHLVLCRNTLIYFTRALCEKVLECLARTVTNRGCLVLGEAETIPSGLKTDFHEISPRSRIFHKEEV